MKHCKHIFSVTVILCMLVLLASQCMNATDAVADPRGGAFAGAAKCRNCHKNIHETFMGTAHNLSSRIASKQTVKGRFNPPQNAYYYRPDVKVVMEQNDSGFFQTAYQDDMAKRTSRFDIVIGSGRKAQTFLYWDGSNLFQLPVSWSVAANNWVNSPNYPPHQVRFDRNIPAGCFECHSSYIKVVSGSVAGDHIIDNFDSNKISYGIDCERCHGPAARHVYFHEQHPGEKKPAFIARYASLQLQQQIDMCAQCHSGLHQVIRSTFGFRPGDTLLRRFFAPGDSMRVAETDVHGNQAQLLMASRCFTNSPSLTCTSCHNVHETERTDMAVFSQRCMHCHNTASHNFCSMAPSLVADITSNCIDCHMPAQPSRLITLLSNGKTNPTPNLVRTHFISVYPEATKKFLRKPS